MTALDISERVNLETQQKLTESALAQSEAKFRHLVEAANDMIGVWGLDSILTYLSPSFQTLLGYMPADYIGKSFAPLVHPDDLALCVAANQQVAETGKQLSGLKFRHQHQQGHWVWVAINISPIKDTSGQVIALQGILRDVSDLKQWEADLRQSRQLLQQILNTIPILMFWKDRDSVYQGCNQIALAACGLTSIPEIVGKTDYDMPWTKAEADGYRRCDHRVMATGQAELNIIETQRQADGRQVILNTNKVPLRDMEGNVTGILVTIEDISERKAAETALQDYADRQTLLNRLANQIRNSLDLDTVIATTLASIRELLDIDSCAFAWYDAQASAPAWNLIQEAKCAEIPSALGCYPAPLVGVSETILFNQEILQVNDTEAYPEHVHREFLQSIHCHSEILLPIRTHANQFGIIICTHHSQVRPWVPGEVELLKAVSDQLAIAIDQAELYTESQAKSQELQHTLQELQRTQAQVVQNEKMSSLGQLVAGIAHEINNPVNFIHGNVSHAGNYAQDLLDLIALYQQAYPHPTAAIVDYISAIDLEFLSQDLPKLLTSMQVGTERIREIVKSLRLFSRLDEAEVKPVDIHAGIDSTLMILQSRIKAKPDRGEIHIIKNYGDLPAVECFAGQLNQVFMNVLGNAIDALEATGALSHPAPLACPIANAALTHDSPTIRILTATQADRVIIRFADNGIGIAPDLQAKIFDPFFTTKPVGKGTGMGLSISYQIVTDKHGGTFSCHSTPGQGSEFVIQIPIQQAQQSILT